jgi:signal transduction histidine kinase
MTKVEPTLKSPFSLSWLTAAIVVTAIALSWFILGGYQSSRREEAAHERIFRLTELRATIVHLDEVLTLSARMAAITGEPKWEKNYRSVKPELLAAIEEADKITPGDSGSAAIDRANKKVNAMEARAFALVRRRRLDEARELLFNNEYEKQERLYSRGVEQLSAQLQNIISAGRRSSRQRNSVRRNIALFLVPIMILMWLVTLRAMRQSQTALMESHQRLESEAQALAELNATLEQRVAERTENSEASRIAALNIMEDAMESREKAEALNRELLKEIAERTQAQDALLKVHGELETRVHERTAELEVSMERMHAAQQEAEAANAAKSEFLSRMSHELRTPLNAILGFGQILDRQELSPLCKESVGHILRGGRHLLDLINEVLDIARVEAGRLDVSPEAVMLNDIVPAVCALMRPLAEERGLRLNESASSSCDGHVLADVQRLRQILINLLSNAIKYNRDDGEVEIFCAPLPNHRIAISVRDTGPGIAPDDLPKLFTPFERLGVTDLQVEGTGLGLPLAERLASVMGGSLHVESVVGSGTTFTLELPEAPPESIPSPTLGEAPSKYLRPQLENNYTVLCIEDNPSNLRLMETVLADRPEIKLITAIQGGIGLELALQHEPDLILLDLNLPDLNGGEVLARLRRSAITRDIPVIVISADASPRQKDKLLAAGAGEYLTKPIDVELLLQMLDKFLDAV